jgi:hypothetical protein
MKNRKLLLPALLSITLVFSLILPAWVAGASVTVQLPDDHPIIRSAVDSSSFASAIALNTPQGQVTPMVAAGFVHTVGLKSDGTVVAAGVEVEPAKWNIGTTCKTGDANMDGVADTGDITKVRRIYFGIDPPIDCADVNGDDFIDTGDVTAIRIIYFGCS